MKISEHIFMERHVGDIYHIYEADKNTIRFCLSAPDEYESIHIDLSRDEAIKVYNRLGHVLGRKPKEVR